jgi:hypothetical protein
VVKILDDSTHLEVEDDVRVLGKLEGENEPDWEPRQES